MQRNEKMTRIADNWELEEKGEWTHLPKVLLLHALGESHRARRRVRKHECKHLWSQNDNNNNLYWHTDTQWSGEWEESTKIIILLNTLRFPDELILTSVSLETEERWVCCFYCPTVSQARTSQHITECILLHYCINSQISCMTAEIRTLRFFLIALHPSSSYLSAIQSTVRSMVWQKYFIVDKTALKKKNAKTFSLFKMHICNL